MFDFDEISAWDALRKEVRLISLRQTTLFPHVVGHVRLETPQDVRLLEDALTTDRFVAFAADHRPDTIACFCRVISYRSLPGGGYDILVVGLRRLRVGEPLHRDNNDGWVQAVLCEEPAPIDESREYRLYRRLLREMLTDFFEREEAEGQESPFDQLFSSEVSLGGICDMLASMFDLESAEKQALLAETSVVRRAARLLRSLVALADERLYQRLRQSHLFTGFSNN